MQFNILAGQIPFDAWQLQEMISKENRYDHGSCKSSSFTKPLRNEIYNHGRHQITWQNEYVIVSITYIFGLIGVRKLNSVPQSYHSSG